MCERQTYILKGKISGKIQAAKMNYLRIINGYTKLQKLKKCRYSEKYPNIFTINARTFYYREKCLIDMTIMSFHLHLVTQEDDGR
jgi:hypothetical protein